MKTRNCQFLFLYPGSLVSSMAIEVNFRNCSSKNVSAFLGLFAEMVSFKFLYFGLAR